MSGNATHRRLRKWRLRRRLLRWGMILFIYVLGAMTTLGIRELLDSVSESKFIRYEPVDVPPPSVSPRHEREREEYERRDRVVLENEKEK